MGKVHQLSPENYIRTKARTLPVYKCLVTPDWQDVAIAYVIVMRKHVNGNITIGFYLVDLLCLGVKDTGYIFNEPEDEINERFSFDEQMLTETDYTTAHNIIYAGHDFAAEFEIPPHKDFAVTKYILEEDDEGIPIMDIEVGDDDGKPHLVVNPSDNYGAALQKLKKNAGEGNYYLTIQDEEDEFEEDDLDEDEEMFYGEDDNEDDEERMIDFHTLKDRDMEDLVEKLEDHTLLASTKSIYRSELLWRRLKEEKPLSVLTDEKLEETPELVFYRQKYQQWIDESNGFADIQEKVFDEITAIHYKNLDPDQTVEAFLKLLRKYRDADAACLMILNSLSSLDILQELPEIKRKLDHPSPALLLFLAAWNAFRTDKDSELSTVSTAATLQEAFPANHSLHAFHMKCFWLPKAIEAIRSGDIKNSIHYHSLVRVAGVGGHLKYFYAMMLNAWLCEYLDIEEGDILFQPNE